MTTTAPTRVRLGTYLVELDAVADDFVHFGPALPQSPEEGQPAYGAAIVAVSPEQAAALRGREGERFALALVPVLPEDANVTDPSGDSPGV